MKEVRAYNAGDVIVDDTLRAVELANYEVIFDTIDKLRANGSQRWFDILIDQVGSSGAYLYEKSRKKDKN